MKPVVLIAAMLALSASTAGACGVERWDVKTLTDPAARQVNFTPKPSTVTQLMSLPAPPHLGVRNVTERSTVTVRVTLVAFKMEGDGDIHLVVGDPTSPGMTMIVEFPDLACTRGAQHRWAMEVARGRLISWSGQPSRTHYKSLTGTATITGVLFFDFKHGQRGLAQNAIELHPALAFRGGP